MVSVRKLNCHRVSQNGSSPSTCSHIDDINFKCFGRNFGTAKCKCSLYNPVSTLGQSMTDAKARDTHWHWSVSDFRWRYETGLPKVCKTAEPAYKAIPSQWTILSFWMFGLHRRHSQCHCGSYNKTAHHRTWTCFPYPKHMARLDFTILASPNTV